MDDPILRAAVLFTRNHQRLIALITVVGTLAGFGYGVVRDRKYKQRAVLMSAATAKDGPIESMDAMGARLVQLVEDRAKSGSLDGTAELEARPIIGQPPEQDPTNALELVATARSAEATEQTIRDIGRTVIESHGPAMKEERDRLSRHASALQSNLDRLEKRRITTESAIVYMQLVRELIDTQRLASPARASDAAFLSIFQPIPESLAKTVALPGLMGLIAGLAGGYGAAFFAAALRSFQRSKKSKNGKIS